jgi:signal transduction histidine kinase
VGDTPPKDPTGTDRDRALAPVSADVLVAERADAIDALAGTLAHEFSNLLTAMTGQLELLLDRFPEAGAERRLLLDVKAGADAAARMTRSLLAISGRQGMMPEPVDLNAVIQESADVLQQIAGGSADLRLDLAGTLPVLPIDPRLVRQVVYGLVAAARDGLAGEGRITVRTSVQKDLLGSSVVLAVADTRPWSDQDLARIFEPQPSTGRQARGAGLALPAIRGTVRQCGGTITCERVAPIGVTFVMKFPLGVNDDTARSTNL